MKTELSFIQNLLKKLTESELLTEYSRRPDTKNTTRSNLYFDLANPDKSRSSKEQLLNNIEKTIAARVNDQARYVWKGDSVLNQKFINKGLPTKHEKAIEGDLDTYTDQLWYYRDAAGKLRSYLDQNGMITPGHEDVIERINAKYGLNLNPNERITRNGKSDNSNNAQQFEIWRDKFFIPWYMTHTKQGLKLKDEYKRSIGELPPLEKPEEDMAAKQSVVEPVVAPEPEYDRTTIDSIVSKFDKSPTMAFGELFQMANGTLPTNATPQQVYNTILELRKKAKRSSYIKSTYPELEDRIDDLLYDYRDRHSEVMGKVESVKDDQNDIFAKSWLTRNGDYTILDKLNNLFRLKKESIENDMTDKQKMLTEGNVFNSINTEAEEFDSSKIASDVFSDGHHENALSEKDKAKKDKLTKDVIDKINDSLKLNKEVQGILDEIRKINDSNDYNEWIVNEEGNTAILKSKNAKIFKQNMNLCLSHDNEIEIFKSVRDLHAWLSEHNYPMPKNIQLHESVVMSEGDSTAAPQENSLNKYDGLGKWIEILGLNNGPHQNNVIPSPKEFNQDDESEIEECFGVGAMGDTTSASLGTALQYLAKNKNKKESLDKESFLDKLKNLKEDDTDVASDFNADIQANSGMDTETDSSTTTSSSAETSSDTDTADDTVDLGQGDSSDNPDVNFGDLNVGGYGPDSDPQEDSDIPSEIPQDEYQIVDVLSDDKGNIQVKVKNLTSGEVEYKSLNEIDV